MGCGASAQADPFTQVVPFDEVELGNDKTQPDEPQQNLDPNADSVPEPANSEQKRSFVSNAGLIREPANSESDQSFVLNADVVPEPTNAVSFKSYNFEPSPANCVPGRRIMPCAPSHRRHCARMTRMLRQFSVAPRELEVSVKARRFLFDIEAKVRDSRELEERRRLRTLLLKEQQEEFERQKALEAENIH
eukprot:TRINITY_DN4825_c0_g1_i2.p1 TRINITY_DN4825_c0_g1~~TRINITY_DN4825_c0_g1_i2.p1  ORF type:complete len:191 (-),score=27.81 TRINITY_DN4825_c0_g1_i2:89-661(-)